MFFFHVFEGTVMYRGRYGPINQQTFVRTLVLSVLLLSRRWQIYPISKTNALPTASPIHPAGTTRQPTVRSIQLIASYSGRSPVRQRTTKQDNPFLHTDVNSTAASQRMIRLIVFPPPPMRFSKNNDSKT